MAAAARNIFFETGKYSLLPASDAALDEVVKVMTLYAHLKLMIEGHTDNLGDAVANHKLSDSRAKAVFDYLVQRGIKAGRIQRKGYGHERPKFIIFITRNLITIALISVLFVVCHKFCF